MVFTHRRRAADDGAAEKDDDPWVWLKPDRGARAGSGFSLTSVWVARADRRECPNVLLGLVGGTPIVRLDRLGRDVPGQLLTRLGT